MTRKRRSALRADYVGRRLPYRQAWSDRGVDQGTAEQNAEAAKRLGIEWPVTK